MKNTPEDIKRLEIEFKKCQKILSAIGDKTRQHLICTMLNGECSGSRVVDIAKRANLSRAAASHHMQILKSAGIVKRPERRYLHILLSQSRYQRIKQSDNLVLRYKGTYEKRSGKEQRRTLKWIYQMQSKHVIPFALTQTDLSKEK